MNHVITFVKMCRITIPMGLVMGLSAGIILRAYFGM
jgi:hypothetical protein